MNVKEPVLLIVLIETARMRWLAGGIDMQHNAIPLLASQDDDLAPYRTLEFEEQASFLRHRFCGALQRGCDRLWGRKQKACQFIFVTDTHFPDAPAELTDRVAEHMVQWMANPPLVFFSADDRSFQSRPLTPTALAGTLPDDYTEVWQAGLPSLLDAATKDDDWETVPLPKPRSN